MCKKYLLNQHVETSVKLVKSLSTSIKRMWHRVCFVKAVITNKNYENSGEFIMDISINSAISNIEKGMGTEKFAAWSEKKIGNMSTDKSPNKLQSAILAARDSIQISNQAIEQLSAETEALPTLSAPTSSGTLTPEGSNTLSLAPYEGLSTLSTVSVSEDGTQATFSQTITSPAEVGSTLVQPSSVETEPIASPVQEAPVETSSVEEVQSQIPKNLSSLRRYIGQLGQRDILKAMTQPSKEETSSGMIDMDKLKALISGSGGAAISGLSQVNSSYMKPKAEQGQGISSVSQLSPRMFIRSHSPEEAKGSISDRLSSQQNMELQGSIIDDASTTETVALADHTSTLIQDKPETSLYTQGSVPTANAVDLLQGT
jgi:hypothetical protein